MNGRGLDEPLMAEKEANQLLNRWEMENNIFTLRSFPPSLNLALTNRCNLSCIMCGESKERGNNRELSEEVFERVKVLFPFLYDINLTGGGENFLYPKFFEIVELIKKYKVYTITSTNGVLIDKEKARQLVLSSFGLLSISIDGATKETLERIRRGADFENLIKNVKRINFFKRGYKKNRPKLKFHFVAMRDNIEELPKLVELAHELWVEEVSVAYLTVPFKELEDKSLFFYKELSDKFMLLSKKKGEELKVKVVLPPLFRDGTSKVEGRRKICHSPWLYAAISIDGKVYPCCVSSMEMGDLKNDDFETIWHGQNYIRLRRTVNSNDPLPECKNCYHHATMDPNRIESHIPYLGKK